MGGTHLTLGGFLNCTMKGKMGLNTWAKAFSQAPTGPHAEKTCNKLIRNSFHEKFLEKWTWDLSAASAEKYPKLLGFLPLRTRKFTVSWSI